MKIGMQIPFTGVPMYCLDCRRQLVSFNQDGTFDLAGKASISGVAEGRVTDGEFDMPEVVVLEATCNRRPCRFKRWIRDINPRRK